YALFPDGNLDFWTNRTGQDVYIPVASLADAIYADPSELFHVPVPLSTHALQTLESLEQAHGFHMTGNYWQDYLGQHEKWIQDNKGNWFTLEPDGQIKPSQAGGLGATVGTVDPAVWDDPDLLFAVNLPAGVQAQLSQLRQQYGFRFAGGYSLDYL